MADRNVTVRLKLEGADQMAAGHEKAARAAEQHAKATKSLAEADMVRSRQQSFRGATRAERDRQAQQGGAEPAAGMGLGWVPRQLMPIVGAAAVSKALGAAGETLGGLATANAGEITAGRFIGDLGKNIAQSLPIIGDLARGVEAAADAVTGFTAAMHAAANAIEVATRRNALQGTIGGIQREGLSQRRDLQRAISDAAAEARLAQAERPLALNEHRGAHDAAQALAIAEARAARRRAEVGQRSLSGMTDDELKRMIAFRQDLAMRFGRDADAAAMDTSKAGKQRLREVGGDALAQGGMLGNLLEARAGDLAQREKEIRSAMDAELAAARQRLELAKQTAAAEQERLDKMKAQLEQAKAIAGALGMAQPGESDEARRIIDAIARGGLAAVTPEEAQFAQRFAPQFIQRQAQLAGQQDPNAQFFFDLEKQQQGPLGIGILGGMEQEIEKLRSKIEADIVEANRKLGETIEAIFAKWGQALQEVMDAKEQNAIQKARNDAERARLQQMLSQQ